jgi:hypothetical protein
MTWFDLLFIALFLGTVATLIVAAVLALRKQGLRALRVVRRLAIGIAAYLAIVAIVSLVSPRHVLAIGENLCSDDWCIAVTDIRSTPSAATSRYDVGFRISSRALRVDQREHDVVTYLLDDRGNRYDPQADPAAVPFDVRVRAQETINTLRTFTVPTAATGIGVVIAREGGMVFPRCCIIGDGFFRKPPMVAAHVGPR